MKLYSYFRSSAAYRVRIALGLKGISFEIVPVDLVTGAQRDAEYLLTNPQGLVPALELDDGCVLNQSMAILEWLEESYPNPPLYPNDALARAQYRGLCQHIGCDIHPLNNLRILKYLNNELALDQQSVSDWYAHWIQRGFSALESQLASLQTPFTLGDRPGMFELMLAPQMYNARRFEVALDAFPRLLALDAKCAELDVFIAAAPQSQPDAPIST